MVFQMITRRFSRLLIYEFWMGPWNICQEYFIIYRLRTRISFAFLVSLDIRMGFKEMDIL